MRLDFGAASDVGLRRRENQDRYHADGSLFAVADGLGGHSGGGTAAGLAAAVLARREPVDSLARLIALVGSVNTAVFEAALDDRSLWEMSTTLCVLADISDPAGPPRLAACNVGDSRLYVLTSGSLTQLTVDHTISQNLVRDGVISPAAAADHVDRHTLTRAVGHERRVHVDGWELAAVDGARFLICSDGLTNEVDDAGIAGILRSVEAPAAAAQSLVQRAVRPGHGRDNATAVVVDVVDGQRPGPDGGEPMVLDSRTAVPA